MSGYVNLFEEVKNKGMRLLVIGEKAATGEYPYGKGYVYARSFENLSKLDEPTDIDIVVFQQEPSEEVRRMAADTTRGVEGSRLLDAWEEDV